MAKETEYESQQALTQLVLKNLIRGKTIEQTAAIMKITPLDVFQVWQGYVKDRMQMSWEEQWVLHLMRLEDLLVKANDMLEYGETDPKAFEATVKILERIEELQDLNKARRAAAEAELVSLTKAQVEILFQVQREMKEAFKAEIESALNQKTIKSIRGELLDPFEDKFYAIQKSSMEVVNNAQE